MDWKFRKYFSREYNDLRETIHYRRSTKCKPPCIVRYRSWWVEPLNTATISDGDFAKTYAEYTDLVKDQNFVLRREFENISKMFKEKFNNFSVTEEKPAAVAGGDEASAQGLIIFSGVWLGIYSRVILGIHEGRLSLTQVFDYGYHQQRALDPNPVNSAGFRNKIEMDVNRDKSIYSFVSNSFDKIIQSTKKDDSIL